MNDKYKIIGTVLSGTLVLVFAFAPLFISDYRSILSDNPLQDLFLIEFNQSDKVEVLARSYNSDVEFYHYKYEKDRLKVYFGRDLVAEIYWQLFDGSKGLFWKDSQPLRYVIDEKEGKAEIIFNFTYYKNPQKTSIAGYLERRVLVWPVLNKEVITWVPVVSAGSSKGYNLRYFVVTDSSYDESVDIDATKRWGLWHKKGFVTDLFNAKDLISSARRYKNGKVQVIFKASKEKQFIDPELSVQEVGDTVEVEEFFDNGKVVYSLVKERKLLGYEKLRNRIVNNDDNCARHRRDNVSLVTEIRCTAHSMIQWPINVVDKGNPIYEYSEPKSLKVKGEEFVFSTHVCTVCAKQLFCLDKLDGYSPYRSEEFRCVLRSGESGYFIDLSKVKK